MLKRESRRRGGEVAVIDPVADQHGFASARSREFLQTGGRAHADIGLAHDGGLELARRTPGICEARVVVHTVVKDDVVMQPADQRSPERVIDNGQGRRKTEALG